MINKKLAALSLIAPLLFAQTGPVQARSFGQIYTQCGLGGMLGAAIENKSAGQILAIISNITWDLGTTAISSQLSSPDTCAAVMAQLPHTYIIRTTQLNKT